MAKVESSREESEKEGIPIRHLVLDLSPVTDCDATGVHFMHDFLRVLSEEGIKLAISNPSKQVRHRAARVKEGLCLVAAALHAMAVCLCPSGIIEAAAEIVDKVQASCV